MTSLVICFILIFKRIIFAIYLGSCELFDKKDSCLPIRFGTYQLRICEGSDQPTQSSGLIDTQVDNAILAIHFVSRLNCMFKLNIIEPQHEISNNVVCATSKASDQPTHNVQSDQSLC